MTSEPMEDWSSRRDLILAALLEGPRSLKELAELTGLRRAEVEMVLVSLKASGLVMEEEVRGLLRRRTVYLLTEEGMREAREARRRLELIADEIRRKAGEGDVEGLEELLTGYSLFLPLLLNLHLIDLVLLQGLGAYEWFPEEGLDEGGAGEGGGWAEL
jgi:DNA-binding MarR family transcriptional regulator